MTLISEEEFNLLASEITNLSREAETVVRKLIKNYDAKKRVEDMALEDLPDEEWRWVIGYEELYQVSNKGRVKSLYNGKEKILRPHISNQTGYPMVTLSKNKKTQTYSVHRLVAIAFIPNPKNKPAVDHMDNNRANACVENLQWVTMSENLQAALQRGTMKTGAASPRAKLTEEQVRYIRQQCTIGDKNRGIRALAKKFNVSTGVISDVVYNRKYKNVD